MPALYYALDCTCTYIHTFSATAAGCHNIMVIFFKEYNYIYVVVLYAYRNDGWCWNHS